MIKVSSGILVKESAGLLGRLVEGAKALGGRIQRGAQTASQAAQKVVSDPNYAHLAKTPAIQQAVTEHAPQIEKVIKSVGAPAGEASATMTDWVPPILQRKMGLMGEGGEAGEAITTAREIGRKAVAPFRKAYQAGLKG